MNLPRSIQQYRVGLGQAVSARKMTSDEAGRKLAEYLMETHPLVAVGILITWCTARFRKYNPLPEGWVQTGLWPVGLWNMPLADAVRYAESQAEMTNRFSVRDQKRRLELAVLQAAVADDMTVTLDEAYRLAYPDDEVAIGQ